MLDSHGRDLGDAVMDGIGAGGFQIEQDVTGQHASIVFEAGKKNRGRSRGF